MDTYELVVPCHFGLEAVTKREIYDLGYEITRVEDGRVTFAGDAEAAWGQIVCRCETVPEAEIVAAIRRRPGAISVEGVKRRCRAGMGRCQSGFCQSRVVAILTRELGCDPSEVLLEDAGSWLVEGPLKGVR